MTRPPSPSTVPYDLAESSVGDRSVAPLSWCRDLPPYVPRDCFDPELPPAFSQALACAAACPDLFAVHAADPESRWHLLARLRRLLPHERWLLLAPDRCRALQLCQLASPASAMLLTSQVAETGTCDDAAAVTPHQLRSRIAQEVRDALTSRLQQLQQLQSLHLEIMRCDLHLAECANALDAWGSTDLSRFRLLPSDITAQHAAAVSTLQQRAAECEARRARLQEQLQVHRRSTEHQAQPSSSEAPPHTARNRFRHWAHRFARVFSRSTSPSHSREVNAAPDTVSSLEHELCLAEKELEDVKAALTAQQQHWQALVRELEQALHAERQRLQNQREQLIGRLGEAVSDGQVLEQELARLHGQLQEVDTLVEARLQEQLRHCRLTVAVIAELSELQLLQTVPSPWDRIIYDNCERLPEAVVCQTLTLAPRQLLLGELLPSAANCQCLWTINGTGSPVPVATAVSHWPAKLVPWLDQRRWMVEGDRLLLRLQSLSPDQRRLLRSEPLLDCPDVLLRFRDLSANQVELAEIVFPATWLFDARRFAAQQLQDYNPTPCGPAEWSEVDGRPLRLCWPLIEALAAHHPSSWIDWGNGVQEWCVWDGEAFLTAALIFDPANGWDRARAEAWLSDLLPRETHQRFALLPSLRPTPADTLLANSFAAPAATSLSISGTYTT